MPPGSIPLGGYPPTGYGPPGMAPMPPPPPKKGMSGAAIALIVVGVVVVLFGGCTTMICVAVGRHKDDAAVVTADPVVKPAPAPAPKPVNDNWITAERPFIKFLAPPGWTTKITDNKEWGIFRSPKNDAVLTFTTFSRPGESTVRLGKAAGVLGVTDINWNAPRWGTVGKDKFDAHVGDGTCNFEGPGAYIWYATVNTGSTDQILLIFAVSPNAPKARRAEAQGAIDSLQRR
jgi:hypothetical protein